MKIEKNLIEKGAFPLLLVSTVIFAGSKRFIQYYPSSSFSGLILQSGLECGTFFALNASCKDKSEIHTILILSISTLFTSIFYHQLSCHFSTLPKGSVKLGMHQFGVSVTSATFYSLLFKTSEEPQLPQPLLPQPKDPNDLKQPAVPIRETPSLQFKIASDVERSAATQNRQEAIQQSLNQTPNTTQPGINSLDDDSLPQEIKEMCQKLNVFSLENPSPPVSDKVLGRFDCVAVPTTMDLNNHWGPYDSPDGQIPFYTIHGAAINIGESKNAQDFQDYSNNGVLDEEKYLTDMGKIFHLMLSAQKETKAQECVWFPFGMGAFLRKLKENDVSYSNQQKLNNLRKKIAEKFMEQVSQFPEMKIHFCLSYDPKKPQSEMNQNYLAFIEAHTQNPRDNMVFYKNVDAAALAQYLANQSNQPYSVSLANGANRNLIGNHWFEKGAKIAIDENLHRRSFSLACLAFLLNGCKGIDSIQKWITEKLHGQQVTFPEV